MQKSPVPSSGKDSSATNLTLRRDVIKIAMRKLQDPAESLGLPNAHGKTLLQWIEDDLGRWAKDFVHEPITYRFVQLAKQTRIPALLLVYAIGQFGSKKLSADIGRRLVKDIPALKHTPLCARFAVPLPPPREQMGRDMTPLPPPATEPRYYERAAHEFCPEWPGDKTLAQYAAERLDEAAATGQKGAITAAARVISDRLNEANQLTEAGFHVIDLDVYPFAHRHRKVVTKQVRYPFLDLPAETFIPDWSDNGRSFRRVFIDRVAQCGYNRRARGAIYDQALEALGKNGYDLERRILACLIQQNNVRRLSKPGADA